jgi:deoxyribodipyrimidine photo-lyase
VRHAHDAAADLGRREHQAVTSGVATPPDTGNLVAWVGVEVRDGRIDSYLRMLWGKRVLAWTRTPEEAFAILVELNNRFAVDGRDANSSSGIAWIFGRFDRPWGPERPIYGTVRYMTSASTARKHRLAGYLARYG